jgi:type IV pilus assembly protein PilA
MTIQRPDSQDDPYTPPKADIAGAPEPEGKRSRLVQSLVNLAIVIAILGILAAIAIPSYSDYTPRARISEVILAMSDGRTAISEFFANNKRLPKDAAEAGWPDPKQLQSVSKYVRELSYDVKAGELRAVVQNHPQADGKTMRMKAEVGDGKLTWRCYSTDIPQKYLPSSCRN